MPPARQNPDTIWRAASVWWPRSFGAQIKRRACISTYWLWPGTVLPCCSVVYMESLCVRFDGSVVPHRSRATRISSTNQRLKILICSSRVVVVFPATVPGAHCLTPECQTEPANSCSAFGQAPACVRKSRIEWNWKLGKWEKEKKSRTQPQDSQQILQIRDPHATFYKSPCSASMHQLTGFSAWPTWSDKSILFDTCQAAAVGTCIHILYTFTADFRIFEIELDNGCCRRVATSDLGPRTSDLGSRTSNLGSRTWDLGPRVSDLGPRTSDLGPRTSNLGPRTSNLGPRTSDLGPRTSDLGPRTSDLGPRTSNLGPGTSNLGPRTSNLGPRNPNLGPRTSNLRDNLVKPTFFWANQLFFPRCFCVFPSLHGCWACWFTWVYVVSQLDLPCQDVVHTSPPCWVYVGSATMTLGLGWVYVYVGFAMLGLYVGLCWICWDVHKCVAKLALGP